MQDVPRKHQVLVVSNVSVYKNVMLWNTADNVYNVHNIHLLLVNQKFDPLRQNLV